MGSPLNRRSGKEFVSILNLSHYLIQPVTTSQFKPYPIYFFFPIQNMDIVHALKRMYYLFIGQKKWQTLKFHLYCEKRRNTSNFRNKLK